MPYTAPEFKRTSFNCPICGAFSKMVWHPLGYTNINISTNMYVAICAHCERHAYWLETASEEGEHVVTRSQMLHPSSSQAPLPHPDMPEAVHADYEEARDIVGASPRSAAALLRLVIQKLCKELGEPGENINKDIASLVKKGLSVDVQEALDVIRVIGNNAVHPGELQPDDIAEVAYVLFELTNQIIDETISKQKKLKDIYSRLPESARDKINKRDGRL